MLDEFSCRLGETSLGLLDTPAEERFDRLTRLVRNCVHVPYSLLTVLTPDRQWFKSAQGTMLLQTPLEVSFCVQALRSGKTLVLENLIGHPEHCLNPVVCGDPNLRFYAGVPLRASDGEWVGTLCALDDKARSITPEELSSLEDLARLAEREISITAWTGSEQAVLDRSARHLRGSLVDEETRAWSRRAILDIALRESERAQQHRRPLSVIALRTELTSPTQARRKAELMRRSLASYQSLGRWQDGFLIVVPELAPEACSGLALNLQGQVEGSAVVLALDQLFDDREKLSAYLIKEVDQSGGEAVAIRGQGNTMLRARCFGSFELRHGDQAPIPAKDFRTGKTRLLLAYLLGCPERRASAEMLIEVFWPESSADSGRNSLRGALSTLRSLLRSNGESKREDPISRDGNFVALNTDLWSDLESFQSLRGSGDEALLRQAIELYRGPYLDGEYEDWVLRRRDQLAEAFLETAGRLACQAFARGDWAFCAQVVEQALGVSPERQDLLALLFRCWLKLARPEAVGKRYREAEKELREFGVEPSIELLELYHRAELGLTV